MRLRIHHNNTVLFNAIDIHIAIIYETYETFMSRIDQEQSIFEQFTLRDFERLEPTALKTLSNYGMIVTNISNDI